MTKQDLLKAAAQMEAEGDPQGAMLIRRAVAGGDPVHLKFAEEDVLLHMAGRGRMARYAAGPAPVQVPCVRQRGTRIGEGCYWLQGNRVS